MISDGEVILTKLFSPTHLLFLQAMVSGKVNEVLMICQDPEPTYTLKLCTPLANTFNNCKQFLFVYFVVALCWVILLQEEGTWA
jgi:hypothetical protein